jgi:hypothetical protein
MFGGFGHDPQPCACGRRAVPLALFLRLLRCRRLVPALSPLRVREVWRFFPPAPRPQGGGKKERFVPCARGRGVSGRWFGWFPNHPLRGSSRSDKVCYSLLLKGA